MLPSTSTDCWVLLIDPDLDQRRIFSAFLEHHGYAVMATDDAATALELARACRPALIIGEHPLALPTGGKLCELLLADPSTREIPFIAVTAGAGSAEVEDAWRTHRWAVVVKPVVPSELLELIGVLARRSLRAGSGQSPAAFSDSPQAPGDAFTSPQSGSSLALAASR